MISRSDYDSATAQQKATEAQVGDIRAAIARKTSHASFTGLLGIRQVSLGQYLGRDKRSLPCNPRSDLCEFRSAPAGEPKVMPGRALRVTNSDLPGMFTARITALDSVINEQTRNIQV